MSGLPVRPVGRDSVEHLTLELNGDNSIFLKAMSDDDKIIAALIEDYNTVSMKTFEQFGYIRHNDIVYFSKRETNKV